MKHTITQTPEGYVCQAVNPYAESSTTNTGKARISSVNMDKTYYTTYDRFTTENSGINTLSNCTKWMQLMIIKHPVDKEVQNSGRFIFSTLKMNVKEFREYRKLQ